jgi:paraquat-inducible protein B
MLLSNGISDSAVSTLHAVARKYKPVEIVWLTPVLSLAVSGNLKVTK